VTSSGFAAERQVTIVFTRWRHEPAAVGALNDPYAKNPKSDLRLGLSLGLGLLLIQCREKIHNNKSA